MTPTIIYQEAYVATTYLNIEFEYKEKIYVASANYYNGSGLEDIEIYEIKNPTEVVLDDIHYMGEQLLFDMDIDSNLTF